MSKGLVVIGGLFFLQAGLVMFLAEPHWPSNAAQDPAAVEAYFAKVKVVSLIGNVAGSLFGALGFWLSALYLKVKSLEQQIDTLRDIPIDRVRDFPALQRGTPTNQIKDASQDQQ